MFTDPTEVHDLQPFINDAIKVIKEEIYEEIPNDIHVKAECSYESFGADIKTESLEESTSDEQDTEDHYSTAKNIKLETPEECGITYQLVKFWPVGNSSEDSSEQRQQSQDVTSSRCRDSSSTKQIIDDSDCIVLSSDESSLDEVKLNNCDTKFPQQNEICNHKSVDTPIQCNICDKTFNHEDNLEQHGAAHSSDRKYKCTGCEISCTTFNKLKDHKYNHCKNRKYQCMVCDKLFETSYAVETHFQLIHNIRNNYKCDVCNKEYETPENLSRHKLVHSSKKNSTPNHCISYSTDDNNKSDTDINSFGKRKLRNQAIHINIRKHRCDLCDKAFVRAYDLMRHRLLPHGKKKNNSAPAQNSSLESDRNKVIIGTSNEEVKKYKCGKCDSAFMSPYLLKRHMLRGHRSKKYRSTKKHISRGNHDNSNAYTRGSCNEILTGSGGTRVYKCDLCEKTYTQVSSVNRHKLSVHNNEMNNKKERLNRSTGPYVSCNPDNENDINKKVFTDSNTAVYNKVECSSIKKHKCNICGKAFRWSSNLSRHRLSVHKNEINKKKGLTSSSEPHVSFNPDNENDINKKVYADSNAAVYNKVEQSSIKEHTCDICGKAFNWLSSMRRHKLCVHKNKKNGANNISQYFSRHNEGKSQRPVDSFGRKYKCNLCGRAFRCFSNLSRHRLSVHKKTAYEANKVSPHLSYHNNSNGNACIVADESQVKLCNKVVSTASVDEQYKCDICGKTFRRSITMSIHKFQFHGINNGIKKYKCSICDKVFLWHQSLKRHKLSVHKIKKNNKQKVFSGISETEDSAIRKYKCNLCDKTFVLRYILLRHELVTHGISSSRKKNKCDICGRIFKKSEYLSIHKFVYHNINSGVMKYKCSICDKVFLWSQSLKRHELSVHKNEKIGKQKVSSGNSETADSGMTRESQMIQHKSSVHENKDECYKDPSDLSRVLFQCADKTEIPTDPADLVKHNICDKNVEKFRCDVCGKNFKNPVNLTQHKVVHMNVKYNCNICSKSFSEPDLLLQHMSLHNGDGNSHQCNVCSKVFTNAQNLKRHKVLHKKIKIFKCNLCDYMFTKSFNLLQHKLTEHSVVREFNCDVCDRGFVTAELLSQHVLLHSDDN